MEKTNELIETDLLLVAGVICKVFHFKRGESAPQHVHDHDHMSVVASGFVAVYVDGVRTDHGPGSVLKIEAGKEHRVHAHTDATWLCIWNEDHVK